MPNHRRFGWHELTAALALASALPGCAVVGVAATAVGVAGAAAGAAVAVGSSVVGTGVKVAGKVVEKAVDVALPGPTAK